MTRGIWAVVAAGLMTGVPAGAVARTATVDCAAGDSVGAAIADRKVTEVIVTGICTESVVVTRDDLVIRGAGGPGHGLRSADATRETIRVDGARRVALRALEVTGGRFGIHAADGAAVEVLGGAVRESGAAGIRVSRGSHARIHGVVTEDHGNAGVVVDRATATITGSTVRRNRGDGGIVLTNGASARIGVGDDGNLAGNTIEDNPVDGIQLIDASAAVAADNLIRRNGIDPATGRILGEGVFVGRASSLRMAGSNVIEGNGNGIFVRDSTVRNGPGVGSGTGQEDIRQNVNVGLFLEENATADLRAGMTISGNGGNGVVVQHGSRVRLAGGSVSGNGSNGILVTLDSSVRILGAGVSIADNGEWGVLCGEPESRFFGDQGLPQGNGAGAVSCDFGF